MPTGPKGRQRDDSKKETKKAASGQKESLMKPNSVAAKSTSSGVIKKPSRRPDSIPTVKYPGDESPISRHATNLTQVMEDEDHGIHETSDYKEVNLDLSMRI